MWEIVMNITKLASLGNIRPLLTFHSSPWRTLHTKIKLELQKLLDMGKIIFAFQNQIHIITQRLFSIFETTQKQSETQLPVLCIPLRVFFQVWRITIPQAGHQISGVCLYSSNGKPRRNFDTAKHPRDVASSQRQLYHWRLWLFFASSVWVVFLYRFSRRHCTARLS